ncbi:MAG: DUF1343 domain-containing protein [Deltaproteobacteria bacterium]|nr:DUF1343 domain-containing protein [Deltaproteobacteria bacterium]
MVTVQTGLEKLMSNPPRSLSEDRLGLLCNPASIDIHFQHARELIYQQFPGKLTALFSPQHGFFAEKQDNMIESDDTIDPLLQVPVFSLYGKTRVPTKDMFDRIDTLIIDLQDAGTRVYTFIYTMSYCLEIAEKLGIKVIVLDRPNPVNGISVEGNCLKKDVASFVGRYPIPMRHGLTIGELAILFNNHFNIGCELDVIPMEGWNRTMYFQHTGLPWVPPSPNLPTPLSAMVYPGQVLWEGTNISEGRGTTQPFELFGAPFISTNKIISGLESESLHGVILRECVFEPTSNKWQDALCNGFQIHVTDPSAYKPYATTLKLLRAVYMYHTDEFEWKSPPYEYEMEKQPIDLLVGDKNIRLRIEAGDNVDEIERSWQIDLDEFTEISRQVHLYK